MNPNHLPTAANLAAAKQNQDTQAAPAVWWATFAKLVAALGGIGGVLLHLIGYIGHLSYMSAWGLESGPFRKDLDEILFMGYLAIMDRSSNALSLIGEHIWAILMFWIALTGYAFLVFRLDKTDKHKKVKQLFKGSPDWVPDLLKSFFGSTATCALFPAGLFFVLFITALPVSIGNSFGKSLADIELKKFISGCERVTRGSRCVEIRKDGNPIGHGFVIESSASHIALFDVDLQRARTIVRDGTELIADTRSN